MVWRTGSLSSWSTRKKSCAEPASDLPLLKKRERLFSAGNLTELVMRWPSLSLEFEVQWGGETSWMTKDFQSCTRKLDWIPSCYLEMLSRVPDEDNKAESSNGLQQQMFLEYSLSARVIRGNSFMWKKCIQISWLQYHVISITIITETLPHPLRTPFPWNYKSWESSVLLLYGVWIASSGHQAWQIGNFNCWVLPH